jgi:hypothetical protein
MERSHVLLSERCRNNSFQASYAISLSSFPSNYFSDAGGNHHPTAASTTNMPAQAPPQE